MLEGKKMNWLTGSLICFTIALIAALFISCAPTWQGSCGPNALYCSATAGEYRPTRIVVGKLGEGYHAVAQVFHECEWRDLKRKGNCVSMELKNCVMKEEIYYTTVSFTAKYFSGRVVVKPE